MLEEKSRAGWIESLARKRKNLFLIGGMLLLTGFIVFVYFGYRMHLDWTGFNESIGPNIRQYQPTKTVWDWLQLLIVPAVLAFAAAWLNFAMNRNERAETKQRAETERTIALDDQRETSLQNYLDRMSDLLLNNHLQDLASTTVEVCHIARVRTLTVLFGLDPVRKGILIRFLYDAGLISVDENTGKSVIDLKDANLSEIDLIRANLKKAELGEADLSGAKLNFARLDEACLEKAILSEANLTGTQLSGADLSAAKLGGAKLRGTNLKQALLVRADLKMANLYKTDMSRADLRGADLRGADLRGANLSRLNLLDVTVTGAIISDETNLEGTILSDKQKESLRKVKDGSM
jgi:uncharacterized protein YjbI with pentapeptide repeats